MPDSYKRRSSSFWQDWEIVMLATRETLRHYRDHCIHFTVNEELKIEAKRAEKYRNKEKTA